MQLINPDTRPCREALRRLMFGPIRIRSLQSTAATVLHERGLIVEHTDGLYELTPRGRGVDWKTFDA